jgi:hypothetical protein
MANGRRRMATSNSQLRPLAVGDIMVGLNPTGRWRVATHLIDGASYVCPHCQALLEVPDRPWRGWVICPGCRLPSLPPERLKARRSSRRAPAHQHEGPQDSVFERPGSLDEPASTMKLSAPRVSQSSPSSASRLIVSTGLFMSAFLLLVAWLDRSSHSLAIFGSLTVIFFILLLRIPRDRRAPAVHSQGSDLGD